MRGFDIHMVQIQNCHYICQKNKKLTQFQPESIHFLTQLVLFKKRYIFPTAAKIIKHIGFFTQIMSGTVFIIWILIKLNKKIYIYVGVEDTIIHLI